MKFQLPQTDAAWNRLPNVLAENPHLTIGGWNTESPLRIRPALRWVLEVLPHLVEPCSAWSLGSYGLKHTVEDALCKLKPNDSNLHSGQVSNGEVILCMMALGQEGRAASLNHEWKLKYRKNPVLPNLLPLTADEPIPTATPCEETNWIRDTLAKKFVLEAGAQTPTKTLVDYLRSERPLLTATLIGRRLNAMGFEAVQKKINGLNVQVRLGIKPLQP